MSAVTGQRLDAAVMSNYTGARDARSAASFSQTDEAARICPAYFCSVSNFFSLSLFFFFCFPGPDPAAGWNTVRSAESSERGRPARSH